MEKRNRRIFAGFYRRYDSKFVYVAAVVPDADTGEQMVIFHEGIDACKCKYYCMTKESFCETVEVNGERMDKFTRQPQVRITDTHIENLKGGGLGGPIRRKKLKDEEELAYEYRRFRSSQTYTDYAKDLCKKTIKPICADTGCACRRNGISACWRRKNSIFSKRTCPF